MPATQTSDQPNIALIGGVVGGVVALLIVIGLIACFMVRNRQTKNKSSTPSQKDLPTAPASTISIYGKVGAVVNSDYISFATDTGNGYELGNIAADANYEKANIEL